MVSSGLRIGTPALATRGFGAAEFTEVADIIASALTSPAIDNELSDDTAAGLRRRVSALAGKFPLYPHLDGTTAAPALEAELIGAAQ
jgi:glycine hydroxymethyltransferase